MQVDRRPQQIVGGKSGLIGISLKRQISPRIWLMRHAQTLIATLGQLVRTPFNSLMTAAVIGIAMALPCGLYALLENVRGAEQGWEKSARISLFLSLEVGDEAAAGLARGLREQAAFEEAELITRDQALDEFRSNTTFGDVLDAFRDDNPLPAVVVLTPTASYRTPDAMRHLVDELGRSPNVELAQFDLEWLERLQAIMAILRRAVAVVAVLLAAGVVVIVGNTIRLGIQNRRSEIEIAKLFGATNGFIRRPFLYSGLWYGLLGSALAWGIVAISFEALRDPVANLASAYANRFELAGLGVPGGLVLMLAGAALGLAGSWMSVGRHLDAIEPP